MMTLMKGMLTTLRKKKGKSGSAEGPETIPASPELIALKSNLSAGPKPLSGLDDLPKPKTEDPAPGPDPALADAAKSTPTRHDVAVLSLSESGEILSARGSCIAVFGWECSALAGKSIEALLKGGFENELGNFLKQRRAGTKTSETVVLRVIALRQDGGEFPVSVTTPTWSLGTRLTHASDTSHLGWTFAFRSVATEADAKADAEVDSTAQTATAQEPDQSRPAVGQQPHPPAESSLSVRPATGSSATKAAHPSGNPTARARNDREDWLESDGVPVSKRPNENAPSHPARTVPAVKPTAPTPLPHGESLDRIWFQRQAVEEANRRVEELQIRLGQKGAELERVKAELEKQKADWQRQESEWRRELDTVAKALGAKLETATTGRQEREKQSDDELVVMRKEREALKQKLEGEQKLAREAQRRLDEAEDRLRQAAREQDSTKAETGKRFEERSRLEFELRAQLEAAKEAGGYSEAALREETLRREKLDQANHELRREHVESARSSEETIARLREERDKLQGKLRAEQQTSAQSQRRVEELESRLKGNDAELARAKEEGAKHRADREQIESAWHKRLEAADSKLRDMEAAGARGLERDKSLEDQLDMIRRERDQIRTQLEAEQRTAAESKKRCVEIEGQLRKVTDELDQFKADAEQLRAGHKKAEAELRARLDEATKALERANADLKEEIGRREGSENRSTNLQSQQLEKEQRLERQLADLRKERDGLRDKLVIEQQALVETGRRIEEMESGYRRSAVEFERTKEELEQQLAERDRAESKWRKDLALAGAQKTEIESALAEANEITKRLESDLAGLRQERDELSRRLAADQTAVSESKRRIEELRTRLNQTTEELDQAKAAFSEKQAERERTESQWQQQLAAGNARRQKIESALTEAAEREKAAEESAARLLQERDDLNDRLAGEHRTAIECKRRAEAAEHRLSQTVEELTRVQATLDEQNTEAERLEAEWQQQLTAVRARKEKAELAWAEATEQHKCMEEELAGIRQECDELKDRLVEEQRAAAESARRAEAAERRLAQNTEEIERAKSALDKNSEDREGAESVWREQLAASKALTRKLEAAWTGAVERSKRMEAELSTLRQEVEDLGGKLTAEQLAASELRRRAEASERRARQYALELERAKTGAEATPPEQGRTVIEHPGHRASVKTPAKTALTEVVVKPAERRNGVRGNSYKSPTTLFERYNLQP